MYFKQKRVWITGASSGIGEALSHAFAAQGAHLILSARNLSELQRVASECTHKGAASVLVQPLERCSLWGVFYSYIYRRKFRYEGSVPLTSGTSGVHPRVEVMRVNLYTVDDVVVELESSSTISVSVCLSVRLHACVSVCSHVRP